MRHVARLAVLVTITAMLTGIMSVGVSAMPAALSDAAGGTSDTAEGGFITAGDQYFHRADGTRFIVIGHNGAPNYAQNMFMTDEYCDAYFKNMADNGGNVLRMLFGLRGVSPRIESDAGVIDPGFKPYLDRLLHYASKHGVYLHISIWSWWTNYYPHFFTDPGARELQNRTLQYLADNWGDHPNIFAWELYNELPAWNWLTGPWVKETAEWFRERVSQMICSSASSPRPEHILSDGLDFVSFHAYGRPGLGYSEGRGQQALDQRVANARRFASEVRARFPDKPVLDTEIPCVPTGFLDKLIRNWSIVFIGNDVFAQNFHDVGKAYLDAGAAGGGLVWSSAPVPGVNGQSDDLTPMLYEKQLELSRYAKSFK